MFFFLKQARVDKEGKENDGIIYISTENVLAEVEIIYSWSSNDLDAMKEFFSIY